MASYAVAADNRPIEYLYESTGATVTTVARPLIFIHADSRASENGAEYLTLAPARIDRSGRIQYVLVAYLWSVGGADPAGATANHLLIEAGEQTLTLQSIGHAASDLGVHQPIYPPPLGPAVPYFYLVNIRLEPRGGARHVAREGLLDREAGDRLALARVAVEQPRARVSLND